jgi:hypothetical protein
MPLGMPDKTTIWNAVLTVVGMALCGIIGLLYSEVTDLKANYSAITATRFTSNDAASLRADLTLTLSNVDNRLNLLDNDIRWMQRVSPEEMQCPDPIPSPEPPSPIPTPSMVPNPLIEDFDPFLPEEQTEPVPEPIKQTPLLKQEQSRQRQSIQDAPRYDMRKK